MNRKAILLGMALTLLVVGSVRAMSGGSFNLPWSAVAGGGDERTSSQYRVRDTVGQPAIGESSGGEFRVKAGYWYGVPLTATPTLTGTIAGQVDLQGRSNDSGALARAIGSATYSATSAANGAFRIDVVSGTYTVTVARDGYLYARRSGVAVSSGATTTLSAVRLLGGDAVADNAVDIYDLTLIGAGFGTSNVAADITGDGAVNIYDLVLVGANFGRAAPLAWP